MKKRWIFSMGFAMLFSMAFFPLPVRGQPVITYPPLASPVVIPDNLSAVYRTSFGVPTFFGLPPPGDPSLFTGPGLVLNSAISGR